MDRQGPIRNSGALAGGVCPHIPVVRSRLERPESKFTLVDFAPRGLSFLPTFEGKMSDHDNNHEKQRLAALYAGMTDGELQLLAHDFSSLSFEGQEALEEEFRRRDLTPEVDLYAPDPGQDVLEWDDLVILRQFRDLPEALLAKGSLESSGIEAFLVDDNMVRTDWFISNLLGGVKLCVRSQDEDAALDVLMQPAPANLEVEGVGTYQQPGCPRCNSLEVSFEALNRPVAYGSAMLLNVPIPLKRRRWKCSNCGYIWRDDPSESADA